MRSRFWLNLDHAVLAAREARVAFLARLHCLQVQVAAGEGEVDLLIVIDRAQLWHGSGGGLRAGKRRCVIARHRSSDHRRTRVL